MENPVVIIHTDASTKNGFSVSCSKIVGDSKCRVRIVKTSNSAGMELQAIISILEHPPIFWARDNTKVKIITDSLSAVKIIKNMGYYRDEIPKQFKNFPTTKEYSEYKHKFVSIIRMYRYITAQWVCSDNPDTHHQEVDQTAKSVLHEYLKMRGKA